MCLALIIKRLRVRADSSKGWVSGDDLAAMLNLMGSLNLMRNVHALADPSQPMSAIVCWESGPRDEQVPAAVLGFCKSIRGFQWVGVQGMPNEVLC